MSSTVAHVRLESKFKAKIQRQADLMGLTLSSYIRMILIQHGKTPFVMKPYPKSKEVINDSRGSSKKSA